MLHAERASMGSAKNRYSAAAADHRVANGGVGNGGAVVVFASGDRRAPAQARSGRGCVARLIFSRTPSGHDRVGPPKWAIIPRLTTDQRRATPIERNRASA
jgi:hypothetical protein